MTTPNLKLLFLFFFVITNSFCQIGIRNTDPKATLDITATNATGTATTVDGIIIPRVTRERAQSMTSVPISTMIYINEVATGSATGTTASVTSIGFYFYNGTTWEKITTGATTDWSLTGNSGTTAGTNFIGTNDIQDFVIKTSAVANTPLERIKVTSAGNVGINATVPTATALLTINPNTNTIRSGIDMTLTNATSAATGLNINAGADTVNGITVTHSSASTSASLYGIGGVLSSTRIVSGYNGYRNGTGLSYGIYGINGTNSLYTTNANTWAAFLQGRTVISSESSPTSALGTDLEIRNTTTGAAAPATASMRQTTSLATSGDVLTNLNFGDNYVTTPQAQIKVLRDAAASSAADMPTAMTFSTTPDASATLTERMRITNAGNVGIGTIPAASTLLDMSAVTNKAMVAPNVALTATTTATISSPANGALIYNTATAGSGLTAVSPGYYYWNGSAWISMSSGGQSSTSYFSTGALGTVLSNAAFTLIPGMTATVTVPANCNVTVTANVGISTNSSSATGYSTTDVALYVDGSQLTNGGYRRISTVNNTSNQFASQQASMTVSLSLSAGSHTFAIYAGGGGSGVSAYVGGASGSAYQGEMTVTILKR